MHISFIKPATLHSIKNKRRIPIIPRTCDFRAINSIVIHSQNLNRAPCQKQSSSRNLITRHQIPRFVKMSRSESPSGKIKDDMILLFNMRRVLYLRHTLYFHRDRYTPERFRPVCQRDSRGARPSRRGKKRRKKRMKRDTRIVSGDRGDSL